MNNDKNQNIKLKKSFFLPVIKDKSYISLYKYLFYIYILNGVGLHKTIFIPILFIIIPIHNNTY